MKSIDVDRVIALLKISDENDKTASRQVRRLIEATLLAGAEELGIPSVLLKKYHEARKVVRGTSISERDAEIVDTVNSLLSKLPRFGPGGFETTFQRISWIRNFVVDGD